MFIHIPLVFTLGFRTFLFFAVGCRMFIHSFNVFAVDFGMVIQIFVVLLLVFVCSFTYFFYWLSYGFAKLAVCAADRSHYHG